MHTSFCDCSVHVYQVHVSPVSIPISFFSVFFLKSMPVGTVAQAMAIDAYKKYSQPIPEEPTDALILENTGIYSTVQVQVYLGGGWV